MILKNRRVEESDKCGKTEKHQLLVWTQTQRELFRCPHHHHDRSSADHQRTPGAAGLWTGPEVRGEQGEERRRSVRSSWSRRITDEVRNLLLSLLLSSSHRNWMTKYKVSVPESPVKHLKHRRRTLQVQVLLTGSDLMDQEKQMVDNDPSGLWMFILFPALRAWS